MINKREMNTKARAVIKMSKTFQLQISGSNQMKTHSHLRNNTFGAIMRSLYQLKLSSNLLSTRKENSILASLKIESSGVKIQMLFLGSWELIDSTLLSEPKCSVNSRKPKDLIQVSNVRLESLITCPARLVKSRQNTMSMAIFTLRLLIARIKFLRKGTLASEFTVEVK